MMRTLLHWLGRRTTAILLHPAIRRIPGVPRIYAALYLFGKSIADRNELREIKRILRPGMQVADIGGNVGFFTTVFARLVGAHGRVFVFEPDPFTRAILRNRTGKFPWVSIVPFALATREGEAVLICNPENRANNALEFIPGTKEGERITVRTVPFDTWWESQGRPPIDIVKMDTEGGELSVLQGMEQFLKISPPMGILFEFSPLHLRLSGTEPLELLAFLRRKGFTLYHTDGTGDAITDDAAFTTSLKDDFANLWAKRSPE